MFICYCKDYIKQMRKIVDVQIFCSNQVGSPEYKMIPFKFCPWCGQELINEDEYFKRGNYEKAQL